MSVDRGPGTLDRTNYSPRILGITPYEARVKIGEWLRTEGQPAYRANQIVPRLWQRPVDGLLC